MTNFNPIQKWFWPGRRVLHNFDPGIFRVAGVNFGKETIDVLPIETLERGTQISYSIPTPIEYSIRCCRPA